MIIVTNEVPAFNLEIIRRSGFIVAKHFSWKNSRNGLVTFATPQRLTVLFQTRANSATSYFVIEAAEVANDEWTITYSNDLTEVINYETR